jgi:hypothetical protein
MFGFLTPFRSESAGPLTDVVAAETFWRTLPHEDPIAAQMAVCETLAVPITRGSPSLDRLRALLALDERARILVDALLFNDIAGGPQSPSLEMQSWQAAFELCRSFGRVHTQFLRSMRDSPRFQGWREYLPFVVLRLFQQRQIELTLRPFVDERSTRFPWKELHEVYRLAQSRELLHDGLPVNRRYSASALDTTPEREYIHVLLQALLNGGHFPPHDALWISQNLPRWSEALALKSHQGRSAKSRFVVDPDGDSGIARSNVDSPGPGLCLDTASFLASIRDEIASLRDVPGRPSEGSSLRPARQLKLLRKLSDLCSPERQAIARRGEREPMALTVEVAVGLPQILRTLRNKPEVPVAAAPRTAAASEGITIMGYGGSAEDSTDGNLGGESTITQWSYPGVIVAHPPLTMVDHSDSGCRLHGPTLGTNPIMPGCLIAFRENVTTPWTLAVVRRVKKRLAGKRVEIGVEYLGRDPRWVIVTVVVPDSDTSPTRPPGSAPSRFAALYLPQSAVHPVLLMKTLVLPARGLAPEDRLSVRSRTSVHTIQLKEPLDEQAEFIWSPFEILDRWLKDEPTSVKATSAAG